MNILKLIFSALILLFITIATFAQKETIRIATWNIEHLGSSGRGFPEIRTKLPLRTNDDFFKIAALIKDTLTLDIVAIQEVNITNTINNTSCSKELDSIINHLGTSWKYYLANVDTLLHETNMQNAFIYNSTKVELSAVFELPVPAYHVGPKYLFDRVPLVGYFKSTNSNLNNEDFILVNLHLASGQHNDENHLAAMVIVEQNLSTYMNQNGISNREYDRIILGDFNDNPYAKDFNNAPKYLSTLYDYMQAKGYRDYVDQSFKSTRMNNNFNSIIDHILVKMQLQDNIKTLKANMYLPPDTSKAGLKKWRTTFSDHFPIYIEVGLN